MRAAIAFLTPLGGAAAPTSRTMLWFPLVGAALGLAVGAVWVGAQHVWPPLAAAAIVIAADTALTGGIHLDGVADSGDGLLPALPRARRLEVMRDPRIGAFGAIALGVVLCVRLGGFASAAASAAAVGALWCTSRTAAAVVTRLLPYARPGGLVSAFAVGQRRGAAAVTAGLGVSLSVPLAAWSMGWTGLGSLAVALVAFAAVILLAARRLGGYTGDVLGAAIVCSETAGLLLLAATW